MRSQEERNLFYWTGKQAGWSRGAVSIVTKNHYLAKLHPRHGYSFFLQRDKFFMTKDIVFSDNPHGCKKVHSIKQNWDAQSEWSARDFE